MTGEIHQEIRKYGKCPYVSLWVLMPNHYHLLLEADEPERLSSIMAGIGRSYVHYHHKSYPSSGHLWQDRFRSQPIEKERYLLACGRYIEQNPVKANIVTWAEDYPYSSASYYIMGKADGLTQPTPLFESFGSQAEERQENYKRFLRFLMRMRNCHLRIQNLLKAQRSLLISLLKKKDCFCQKEGVDQRNN